MKPRYVVTFWHYSNVAGYTNLQEYLNGASPGPEYHLFDYVRGPQYDTCIWELEETDPVPVMIVT